MKRTQIYLTKRQLLIIKKESCYFGISVSELIRRVLDKYVDNIEHKLDKKGI